MKHLGTSRNILKPFQSSDIFSLFEGPWLLSASQCFPASGSSFWKAASARSSKGAASSKFFLCISTMPRFQRSSGALHMHYTRHCHVIVMSWFWHSYLSQHIIKYYKLDQFIAVQVSSGYRYLDSNLPALLQRKNSNMFQDVQTFLSILSLAVQDPAHSIRPLSRHRPQAWKQPQSRFAPPT